MNEKTIVEHYLHGRGHLAYFLPTFHCELNAIEIVWAQAKVYCRAHSNFTLVKLFTLPSTRCQWTSSESLPGRPETTNRPIGLAIERART